MSHSTSTTPVSPSGTLLGSRGTGAAWSTTSRS